MIHEIDATVVKFQRLLTESAPGVRFETEIRPNPRWGDVVASVVIVLPPGMRGRTFRRTHYRDAIAQLTAAERSLLAIGFEETVR